MLKDITILKDKFKGNNDFILRDIKVSNKTIYLAFFESLCDAKTIYEYVTKNIENYKLFTKSINNIEDIISSPKLQNINNIEEDFYYLENGFCLVFFDNEKRAIEVRAELDRGITASDTEPAMYGPKDAFCENYQKNLGLLKRRIKNKNLKVDTCEYGVYTKTKVSLIYIDKCLSKSKITKIKNILKERVKNDICSSQDIENLISLNKIFPTVLNTEKPTIASNYLLKGYVLVMVDNSPFCLIIDVKLKDLVNPSTIDPFVKTLRYICLFLTVITPALYIALINFNQETIPLSLLINFTMQRSSVPFPALIEALLMLGTCEVLREADIRFPNSYGSAASILGALILGESAVSAGIVSAIMIIVVAITFITNLLFTEIKFVSAIRIMRFIFLIVACFLGLYGLTIAFIFAIALLANTSMYEGTYL